MSNFKAFVNAIQVRRWIVLLAIAGLIAWNVYWVLNYEPEHDEVEHWHAAWLMHQGKTPFYDFFEHHSPALWMILRLYYDFIGDNYGIIITTRLMMIAIFFFIVLLTYRIALNWMSRPAAWIAALGFPLLNVGYFMAHVQVRGDPMILLLLIGALYFAVPLAEKRTWDRVDLEKLFLIFALLGVALGISPRAGIPVLSLFLLLGWTSLGVMPLSRLIGLFFIGGLVIVVPTIVLALPYGLEIYGFWVYKFSALILPFSSPMPSIVNLAKSALPITVLMIIGFYRVARRPELRSRRSLRLLIPFSVINFLGLWACRHPFMQHFLMAVPFLGFFAGMGYDELIKPLQFRRWLPRWNFGRIAIILALMLLSAKFYIFSKYQGDATLTHWVKRSQWMMEYAGKNRELAAATAFYGPIFMPDAFYYWFGARYVSPTLQTLRNDFKPYTFEQLRAKRPALLHVSFPDNWHLNSSPEFQSWLEANYTPGQFPEYWVCKDLQREPKTKR